MAAVKRQKVMITGAAGGMGRACARLFGMNHDLILSDVAAPGLTAFADTLKTDGYTVSASIAGDLCDEGVLASLTASLDDRQPFTLLHTAGLSPSQADWQSIMRVNLLASEKLMHALEPLVVPGTVAILIASTAGHGMPALPDIDAVMSAALETDLVANIAPFVEGMAPMAGPAGARGISYSLSKRGVIRLGQRKAKDWGPLGGRVVTISPGLMLTPMGKQELEKTEGARAVLEAAPVGRAGTAMDIALVARFLASADASFISGSDVLVDGGAVSAMQLIAAQGAG